MNCICVTTTLLVSVKNNTVFMHCSTDSLPLSAIWCKLAHERAQHDTSVLGKSKNCCDYVSNLVVFGCLWQLLGNRCYCNNIVTVVVARFIVDMVYGNQGFSVLSDFKL
jgi:hypothetical protein